MHVTVILNFSFSFACTLRYRKSKVKAIYFYLEKGICFFLYVFAVDVIVRNMKGFINLLMYREKRKKERNPAIILDEPGKYFTFLRLPKYFDISQGSTKNRTTRKDEKFGYDSYIFKPHLDIKINLTFDGVDDVTKIGLPTKIRKIPMKLLVKILSF